jgi:fructose-1-phosphate kinase PfkB-like protein
MLECTTSPLCFVIYQAAENDMEVVNTVSDGDCLLDAFITSSFSNKKIASGAL